MSANRKRVWIAALIVACVAGLTFAWLVLSPAIGSRRAPHAIPMRGNDEGSFVAGVSRASSAGELQLKIPCDGEGSRVKYAAIATMTDSTRVAVFDGLSLPLRIANRWPANRISDAVFRQEFAPGVAESDFYAEVHVKRTGGKLRVLYIGPPGNQPPVKGLPSAPVHISQFANGEPVAAALVSTDGAALELYIPLSVEVRGGVITTAAVTPETKWTNEVDNETILGLRDPRATSSLYMNALQVRLSARDGHLVAESVVVVPRAPERPSEPVPLP